LVALQRGAGRGSDNCTAATVIAGVPSIPAQKDAGCRDGREHGLPQRVNPFPACKWKTAMEKTAVEKMPWKNALAPGAGERHSYAKPARLKGGKLCKQEAAPWTM